MIEYYCPHCKSPLVYTGATFAGENLLYCAQCNKQIEFSDAEENKISLWGWVHAASAETKEESSNEAN